MTNRFTRKLLLEVAERAGCDILHARDHIELSRVWRDRTGCRSATIALWPDGSANRTDIDLVFALNMSNRDVARALGLL